jgi:hypothetical protein
MTQVEWKTINRERGQLIDLVIAGTITEKQKRRLSELEKIAEEHIEAVAPRSTATLDRLEDVIVTTQLRL